MSYIDKNELISKIVEAKKRETGKYPTNDKVLAIYDKGYKDGFAAAFTEFYNIIVSMNEFTADWKSVSESMPKPFTDVLLSDGENVEFGYWSDNQQRWVVDKPQCYGEITHWLKIPNSDELYYQSFLKPILENKMGKDEDYIDEVGGIHMPGNCYNPVGYFCGECSKSSCKNCAFADYYGDEDILRKTSSKVKLDI